MGMTRKDPGQLGPGGVGKVELGGFPTLENLRGFSASGPLYPIHPTIGPIGPIGRPISYILAKQDLARLSTSSLRATSWLTMKCAPA